MAAPPWNTWLAISGSVTWNSQASVPMTAIMTQRDEQLGGGPDVAQPLPDLALAPGHPAGREQLGPAHQHQGQQHGAERQRVAGVAQGQPEGGGDDPADRGAETRARFMATEFRVTALGRSAR